MARPIGRWNSRQAAWARQVEQNQHEVVVLSTEEMAMLVERAPISVKEEAQRLWKSFQSQISLGSNYIPAAVDSVALAKLVGMLGGGLRGVAAKVYYKQYQGKTYIIFKGYAGFRKLLTGTRYLANNATVVKVGLGRLGANAALKSGGILSLFLVSAYRIAEYFLSDEQSLARLIGGLASDVVKVGITMGASWLAIAAAGTATLAIGPLLVAVAVGVLVTVGLNYLDEQFGLTDKLVKALEVGWLKAQSGVASWSNFFSNLPGHAEEAALHVLDVAMESAKNALIQWGEQHLNRLIRQTPRLL